MGFAALPNSQKAYLIHIAITVINRVHLQLCEQIPFPVPNIFCRLNEQYNILHASMINNYSLGNLFLTLNEYSRKKNELKMNL